MNNYDKRPIYNKCIFRRKKHIWMQPIHQHVCTFGCVRMMQRTLPDAHTQSNLIHMNNSLSNITGLHKGWTKVMQLEYGNECRFAVRTISLPYFKQAIATKQPDSIQTETMQPMCPCGATQTSTRICSIPLVCTKVGRKTCT